MPRVAVKLAFRKGQHMNTIFHIDDPRQWPTVRSNLQHMSDWLHHQKMSGQIILLINGEAVSQAVKNATIDLQAVIDQGVQVAVCHHSMTQRGITRPELQPGLTVVPSGVVELALRQHAGFAYIKP